MDVRSDLWLVGTNKLSGPGTSQANVRRVSAPDTLVLEVSASLSENLSGSLLIANQSTLRPAAIHIRSAEQVGSNIECRSDTISFLATRFMIDSLTIRDGVVLTRSVIGRQWRVPQLLYRTIVNCVRTGEKFIIKKWVMEEHQSVFILTPSPSGDVKVIPI